MAKAPEPDLKCYGVGNVTASGQITVPSEARGEIGITPNGRVMVFGDRANGRLIVFPAPPDDKLYDFVTEHAARAKKS